MAELINQKPKAPEPFKIGKDPKIKVKARRPVLLGHHDPASTPTRVDKDEIGYVEEEEFKRHEHILEKLALLIALLSLLFLPSAAKAQSYSANQNLATNAPLFSTNINLATGNIAGGAMATNAVANAATNAAMLTTPVGLTRYDQVAVELTWSPNAGASTLIGLQLYPSADGVNVDTNHPVATITGLTTTNGFTNGLLVTNLNNSVLGSVGYLGAGVTNPGTNTATNIYLMFIVKPQRSG